jgi:hypothetical protein
MTMARTAIYRGQRFHVVDEGARFVTLEGFGYKKKVQLEEVIFEDQPIEELASERGVDELISSPVVEEMPSERQDNDILSLEEIEETANEKKLIKTSYETWDQTALEAGDTDDRGWENEHGVDMTPNEHDAQDGVTAVSKAITFLKDNGAVHPSGSHFGPRLWYSTEGETDPKTGKVTVRSFHLDGFSLEEQEQIFNEIKKGKLRESLSKLVVPAQPESDVTPAPDVSEKVTPDFPKFGLDLSVDTAADRHKENEDRRKNYVSDMKLKLKEMMDKLDEMDSPVAVPDEGCDMCAMDEARQEGVDFPYETFEKFFDDFMDFAQSNQIVNGQGQINIPEALVAFSKEKFVPEFIQSLGGPQKVLQILIKKVSEVGEPQLAEDAKKLEEDGAAPASGGGGVPNSSGAVDVPLKGDGGVSTANVANFNARLGGKIKRDDKMENIKE